MLIVTIDHLDGSFTCFARRKHSRKNPVIAILVPPLT